MATIVISGSAGRSVIVGTNPGVEKTLREAISSCLSNAANVIGGSDISTVEVGGGNSFTTVAEGSSDVITGGSNYTFYASGSNSTLTVDGGADTLTAGAGLEALAATFAGNSLKDDAFTINIFTGSNDLAGRLDVHEKSAGPIGDTFSISDTIVVSFRYNNKNDIMLFKPPKNNARESPYKSLRSPKGVSQKLIEDVARSCGASIEDARHALLDLQAKSARAATRRVVTEAHARYDAKNHVWEPPPYALPTGLRWPKEQFDQSSEFRKRGGIVRHLDRVWRLIIAAKAIDMPTLRAFYPSTASAIDDFKYRGIRSGGEARSLPLDLDIPLVQPRTERRRQTGAAPPSPTG
jgi:hypothetical protein